MRYIPLICLLLLAGIAYSQDAAGRKKYLVAHISVLTIPRGVFAVIESEKKPIPVLDKQGKKKNFKITGEVYEYMDENGWQLVSAAPLDNNALDLYCVFKRKEK